MAQKKCPKCGEDNPAEAVMCWACYTPLSGGPAAAPAARAPAGKPPGPPGAAGDEEGEKKKFQMEPKMIGVIAFLVIGGGIGVFLNMPKSSSGDDGGGGDSGTTNSGGGGGSPAPAPPAPAPPGPGIAAGPVTGVEGGANMPAAVALPYSAVVPPNPKQPKATIGIVPSQAGTITDKQAASLARFAKNQYQKSGQWSSMQIFVFNNQSAAQSFGDYQARKRGTPLSPSDYQALANANVWNAAPACFESSGKKEFVYYPSKNPFNWWSGRKSG